MLRFSIKDLFGSITLIAVGMAALSLILPPVQAPSIDTYLLWFGAGPLWRRIFDAI